MATGNEFYYNLPKEKQEQYAILFEDKNSWFTTDENGNQDWSNSKDKIAQFNKALEAFIKAQDDYYDLSYICFPMFNLQGFLKNNTVDGNISFLGSIFKDEADFSNSTFKDKADFLNVTFSSIADFRNARFKDKADFLNVTFSSIADFRNARFKDEANFWYATFKDEANFWYATFKDEAKFFGAIFKEKANFRNATFKDKAKFFDAIFKEKANFRNATFEGDVYFNDVTAKKTIDLNHIHFEEFFDASGMSFNLLNIEGTYFESPLLLDLSAYENGRKVPLEPRHFANKESARLIKDHFEKQNNITEANKYFRIEQEKHIEALKREETKEHNKLGALITLYLNKYVSNFGIDWFRGLLTLSLFGYVVLFFYMALRYSPFNYPNQFYMAGDWQTSNLSTTLFIFIVIAILYTINLKYVKIQEKLSNLKRYSVVKRYKKIFWLLRITRNIISNVKRYKIILSIVVIICVLSYLSKNDTTNLITQLLNPLNAFKDVDTYKGYEAFGAIVRIISATIIYQIIVAFRQNTRRK